MDFERIDDLLAEDLTELSPVSMTPVLKALKQRIEEDEHVIDQLHLIIRALLHTLADHDGWNAAAFKRHVRSLDLLDGKVDGKFGIDRTDLEHLFD